MYNDACYIKGGEISAARAAADTHNGWNKADKFTHATNAAGQAPAAFAGGFTVMGF
jgi:hypothetical protein